MTSHSNPQLANVPDAFNAIALDGTVAYLSSNSDYSTTSESHLQGFALYNDMYVITQNRHDETEGKIYFFHTSDGSEFAAMHLSVSGNDSSNHDHQYNHPGGIQVIGDYLLIPIQTQDYNDTIVQLYDLSKMDNSDAKLCLVNGDYLRDSDGNRYNGKYGGIGIVDMGSYFLLATVDGVNVYFFKSTSHDIVNTRWSSWFEATMSDDASEVCLLADSAGTPYMVSFSVDQHGQSYADHGFLYQIDTANKSITQLADRHFDTNNSSVTLLGPHFRWGAGIYFPTSTTLGLMTTQRVMQKSCSYDLWS